MDEQAYTARAARRRLRRRRARQRRCLLGAALLLVTGALAWHFFPRPYYTAQQLGITQLQSPLDADGDGVDDYTDILLGARDYIATKPYYKSTYYVGGYPNDGNGVCTDVIWQALQAAGYHLKELVDRDILDFPASYPQISAPDPNIDFRRVENLDSYLRRHAQVLTCSLDDPSQWQPGDIAIFGDTSGDAEHIGICSDRRNRRGIPFLIHHGDPVDGAVERDDMHKMPVTGHYRWDGSRV